MFSALPHEGVAMFQGVFLALAIIIAIVFAGFIFLSLVSYPIFAILYVLCASGILIAALSLSGKISGSFIDGILGASRRKRSFREQLSGDLERTKECKRKEDFGQALCMINEYLDQDPDYPEALYLKAQILSEGFGRFAEARRYLKQIIQMIPDDQTFHRWALSYYDEVKEMEKREETQLTSNEK
ncbi:MAG: tetratricopeptide repeat protein [Deltaproteobacteria bacterium]|nr:tetratricopeptide repeat protein [Deltaproteobacteria bacterium]